MARRGKPLKRFERTLRGPMFTWLKPGENESATSRRLATCRSLLTIPHFVLPTSCRSLTKRNATAAGSTFPNTRDFTFSITNAAAEFASMGRSDFVSWIAVGSCSCDRPDAGWIDVVCDRWRLGEIRRTEDAGDQRRGFDDRPRARA